MSKTRKNLANTKEKVARVFNQAKDSLKLLETLEKETITKARSFMKIPSASETRRMTNEHILASLRRIGVADASQVAALEKRVSELESQVAALSAPKKTRTPKETETGTQATA